MSYRRSFTKRIAIHYSGTVHYPASQEGGSVSYSGTEYEDVEVNVEVDTNPFDSSVQHCNTTVGLLTGAVVATESAQIASIKSNAAKIGQTIVDGFFKTVRSEISQQIMELSNRIEATLLHLNALTKRCIGKRQQMEQDYNRLSEHYLKMFEDLNSELKNRVYELDRPTFIFKQESDKSSYRALGSDMVGTVTVAGAENNRLEAKIGASVTKKRALDTIEKAYSFLEKQKQTSDILLNCIRDDAEAATYYIPVCYVETNNPMGQIDRNVYQPGRLGGLNKQGLITELRDKSWRAATKDSREQIQLHFNSEVSTHCTSSNSHDDRVRDYISRLFNINTIQTL